MKVIIPVSDLNRYSPNGDMALFGETTLAEWKISQTNEIKNHFDVYITTSSANVYAYFQSKGIKTILRSQDNSIVSLYQNSIRDFNDSDSVLWLNPTSPFIGPRIIQQLIDAYDNARSDCLVTAIEEQEYFYNAVSTSDAVSLGAINKSRSSLDPMIRVTNGAYLCKVESIKKNGTCLSPSINFLIVPWLASLEIKNSEQFSLYSELICKYFEYEYQ